MDAKEFIFTSSDSALKHVSISVSTNVIEHESYEAKVYDATDGDTLRVRLLPLGLIERVRLLGIDTPETGTDDHARNQCKELGVDMSTLHSLAKIATIHLQWLCPKGAGIILKTTGRVRDDKNRILAGVIAGDVCINQVMVEHGYAVEYEGDWESYGDLALHAREGGRGIWGQCDEAYYLASSETYHRPGCSKARYATRRFTAVRDAKAVGLEPCSACIPDFKRP